MAGAPLGNKNGARGAIWREAVIRALDNRSRAKQRAEIDALADKLIDLALDGDLGALKEVGDRLEGKPKQQVDLGNAEGSAGLFVQVLYGAGQDRGADLAVVPVVIETSD